MISPLGGKKKKQPQAIHRIPKIYNTHSLVILRCLEAALFNLDVQ